LPRANVAVLNARRHIYRDDLSIEMLLAAPVQPCALNFMPRSFTIAKNSTSSSKPDPGVKKMNHASGSMKRATKVGAENYSKVSASAAASSTKNLKGGVEELHDFFTTKSPTEPVPRNQREARASAYWPDYYGAECEEMENHSENGTWKLVKRSSIPKGGKLLQTKWVYDDKKGPKGNIIRFKARLTAMGNRQREGIDYFDTFAPVMRTKTFRVLMQLWNASSDHNFEHWDIKAAFINAPIEEDIWISQPNGHEVAGSEDMVCGLPSNQKG
jgi:hypothetical protein